MAKGRADADERGRTGEPSGAPEGLLGELHRERLPNGIRLWVVPMATQNMVALRLAVPAGAQYEDEGESGLAHFVEHLFADRSFDPDLETLWSDIEDGGGMVNAITSPEQVVMAVEVRPGQLAAGLELIHFCLSRADFSVEHVENERRLLLRELQDYGDRLEGVSSLVWKRMLQDHPITRNPAGDLEGIRGLEPERLEAFFDDRYRAGGLTLIITGKLELEHTRTLVLESLGTLDVSDEPTRVDPPKVSEGPIRSREARNLEEVLVGYRVGGVRDQDYFALWYIRDHLDEVLYERIRREMHVYHLSCELVAGPGYGVLYVWAQLPSSDHDRLVDHVDEAFGRLKSEPLAVETWSKLRQRMVNRSRRLSETADELAFHLLGLANHYDVEEPVPDDVLVLAAVERTDLFDAANRHFVEDRRAEARARQSWFRSHIRTVLLPAVALGLVAGLWENCHRREEEALRRSLDACRTMANDYAQELEECNSESRDAYKMLRGDLTEEAPDSGSDGSLQ